MQTFSHLRLPLLTVLLLSAWVAPAHADLFFSEYVEGSGNNKALEIYNPGSSAVDLSGYSIKNFDNGKTTAGTTWSLSGTLEPGAVYVLARTELASQLGSGIVQQETELNFNGDDALVLFNGDSAIDRIGQVGSDPGSAWTSNGVTTANMTLRRLASVATGDPAYDTAFDPSLEWQASSQDDFSGLGLAGQETAADSADNTVTVSCGDSYTAIADIQGDTDSSPLQGETVSIEGIVTAAYLGSNGFSGFYVQTADSERSNLAKTSEAIFVYAPELADSAVSAGSRVHLQGAVSEYNGLTEITLDSNVALCASEQNVSAIEVTLPLADGTDFEDYEGMRVDFKQKLYVNDVYYLTRYGYMTLGASLMQVPTQIVAPGDAAATLSASNARARIILDDGSNAQNPAEVIYPQGGLSASNTLRRGYSIDAGISGVLDMRNSDWRIQPLPGAAVPTFSADNNPRPDAIARTEGSDLRVASFNVLNYFNGDGQGGGFPTSRGAQTLTDFERQRAKIVSAINGLDADLIGLMEIENDGYASNSAIVDLVGQLGTNWTFVNPGVDALGSDEITVALIYRSDKVEPIGQPATLAIDDKNRQPLAQTFRPLSGGKAITLVVNHLKSKSCSSASDSNADQGDGQSCWNPTRVAAATAIGDWLKTTPTGVADAGVLLVGDMNAYAKEDPISTFASYGYANMLAQFGGDQAYTYVYDGEAGNLDHALADNAAAASILNTRGWAINADEPYGLQYSSDYKSEAQLDSLYAADAYRSSDHDPVVIDLAMADTTTSTNASSADPLAASDDSSSGGGAIALLAPVLLAIGWLRGRRRQPCAGLPR
jgi:predicted extracellular nuclease